MISSPRTPYRRPPLLHAIIMEGLSKPYDPYRDPLLLQIDNGFFSITGKLAGQLAKNVERKLPRHGMELCVRYKNLLWWLTRTPHNGKQVWAIYHPRPEGKQK